MKNLFSFATRELSQDAFLRWIFENYNCEDADVKDVSRLLLKEFTGIQLSDTIESLKTDSQRYRIDITVIIELTDKKVALFIEDKTKSKEHSNQLKKYNESIEKNYKEKEYEVYKVYYKTDTIEDDEIEVVTKAQWNCFDIKKIVKLFHKYENSSNLILKSYVEHIFNVYNSLRNNQLPIENKNLHEWKAYFNNVIKPKIDDISNSEIEIGWYGYTYMAIVPRGYLRKGLPYLEIRSRDCTNNVFKCRILLHGVVDSKVEVSKKLIQNEIKRKSDLFTFSNRGTKLAGYSNSIKVKDTEEFIIHLKKCLLEYIDIIDRCALFAENKIN